MNTAVIPGSFDPITNGHLDIIRRASAMYDEVIVLSACNSAKNYLLTDEKRLLLIKEAIKDIPNARAESFGGMLADYVAEHNFPVLVKGVRDEKDFTYEQNMAFYNSELCSRKYGKSVETVFLPSNPSLCFVSSSLVRTLFANGAEYSDLIPCPDLFNSFLNK